VRRKDAIPSWSGYNYQGKATILCVLSILNEIINSNGNPEEFSVELEKIEDFVLYKNDEPISLYQVKARLSSFRYSSYISACNKLINKKEELKLKNYNVTCHLVAAVDISDWIKSASKEHRKEICLYKYKNTPVDICKVAENIKSEIDTYLEKKSIKLRHRDSVYHGLCRMLDEKVADFHSQGSSSQFKIRFGEFCERIGESISCDMAIAEATMKEKIYEHLTNTISSEIDNYSKDSCNDQCQGSCGINKHSEHISQIGDNRKYIKILNPNKADWKDLDFVTYIRADDYRSQVLEIFSKCDETEVLSDGNVSYIKNRFEVLQQKELIPTLMRVAPLKKKREDSLQGVLDGISKNTSIAPYVSNKTLSGDFGKSLPRLSSSLDGLKITFIDSADFKMNHIEKELSTMNPYHIFVVDVYGLLDKYEENTK